MGGWKISMFTQNVGGKGQSRSRVQLSARFWSRGLPRSRFLEPVFFGSRLPTTMGLRVFRLGLF
jgi:hypothetical protein